MKETFLLMFSALAGFAGLIIPTNAQAQDQIVVTIPFQFVAAGQTLPAGEYRISRLDDSEPTILLLSSLENRANIAMLRAITKEPANGKAKLDFTTVGDLRFLSRMETANNAYDLSVPSSELLQAAPAHLSSPGSNSSAANQPSLDGVPANAAAPPHAGRQSCESPQRFGKMPVSEAAGTPGMIGIGVRRKPGRSDPGRQPRGIANRQRPISRARPVRRVQVARYGSSSW